MSNATSRRDHTDIAIRHAANAHNGSQPASAPSGTIRVLGAQRLRGMDWNRCARTTRHRFNSAEP